MLTYDHALTYFYIMLIALAVGVLFWIKHLYDRFVPGEYLRLFCMLTFVMLFFGSIALGFFMTRFDGFALCSLGGAIGVYFSYYTFAKYLPNYKDDFWETVVLSCPLMYGIGKIGCATAHCCYGFHYDGILAVFVKDTSYFPIQKLESIVFLTLFVVFYILAKKNKLNCDYAIIAYAVSKFLLDFLRYTHETSIISFNQVVCLLIIAFMGYKIKIYSSNS